LNLLLNRADNFVNPTPLVLILSAPLDHTKALQDVDDVVDATALDAKLPRALVQVEQTALRCAIQEQESTAKFTETLLLPFVSGAFHAVVAITDGLRSDFKTCPYTDLIGRE